LEVDFAFICDYADASGPKVHALGIGFDTIFAPTVPAKHPQFTFVAQLRASAAELGAKEVAIRLIDADGNTLINIPGQVNIERPLTGLESVQKVAVQFHMVEFPRFGDYALHLVVGGIDLHRVRIRVSPMPQPA
jgi:hypothetical protein